MEADEPTAQGQDRLMDVHSSLKADRQPLIPTDCYVQATGAAIPVTIDKNEVPSKRAVAKIHWSLV